VLSKMTTKGRPVDVAGNQGNDRERGGRDERVSAPKRDSEPLVMFFSGSAGDNEGGAGTLGTLRQLQIHNAVETKTRTDTFLALAVPPLNRSPQP
jgi:hypothetical protein